MSTKIYSEPGLNREQLEAIKKILVIQLGPIGDALLTSSYFRALKAYLPQAELHLLIKQQHVKAINKHPYIDKVIPIEPAEGLGYYKKRWEAAKTIRAQHYDLIIDQQNDPASKEYAWFSGARHKLGYPNARFQSLVYTVRAPRKELRYSAQRKFDMVAPLGLAEEKAHLFFHIDDAAHHMVSGWLRSKNLRAESFVCLSPSSPVEGKKWKAEHYAQLGDRIVADLNLPVVLIWGPGEFEDAQNVQNRMQESSLLAPKTSLMEIAALIKQCALLVCNCGGLNHLAVTTQTETLCIFGPTDPVVWSPASVYGTHHHLHDPQHDSTRDCSFGIGVQEVFGTVSGILETTTHAART